MTGYTVTVILFWVGVIGLTLVACWFVDFLCDWFETRRYVRDRQHHATDVTVPFQRTRR